MQMNGTESLDRGVPQQKKPILKAGQAVLAWGLTPGLAKGINPFFEAAFVVSRLAFMDQTFASHAVEVGFGFAEQECRFCFIFGRLELLDERTHAAAMVPVLLPAFRILADALHGRFVLRHDNLWVLWVERLQ